MNVQRWLSEMFPNPAVFNRFNRRSRNTEHFRDLKLRVLTHLDELSNASHLIFRKFGFWVIYSLQGNFSTFLNHILRVIGIGSKKEMPWITTNPIVAGMAHQHTFRNFPESQLPSHTVGLNIFSANREITTTSVRFDRSMPFPAFVRRTYFDLIPKPLRYCQNAADSFRPKRSTAFSTAKCFVLRQVLRKMQPPYLCPANGTFTNVIMPHFPSQIRNSNSMDIVAQVAR